MADERYRENRVALAERDGELVGIAMSGPPLDVAVAWTRQLYVLYVYAADHGTGAGPALLEAVVDPEESAALWVAARVPSAAPSGTTSRNWTHLDPPGHGLTTARTRLLGRGPDRCEVGVKTARAVLRCVTAATECPGPD